MITTTVRRHLASPRKRVFAALVDPRAVGRWRVPQTMRSEVHVFDPRPGGAIRVSLTYEDPTRAGKTQGRTDTYRGVFVEVVPCERVVERIEFETDDPSLRGTMTVTIGLSDAADGGTDLAALHEGLPPGVLPEDNELGWSEALARLAALVEGGDWTPPRAPDE